MKTIAAIILENPNGELLLYKRDNKPDIPFPGYWDLIGGHVEDGETPEQALVREIKEELNIDFTNFVFFKEYLCTEKDAYPNVKYIYAGIIDIPIDKITLLEGDYPMYFKKEQIQSLDIANIQKHILIDYIDSDL